MTFWYDKVIRSETETVLLIVYVSSVMGRRKRKECLKRETLQFGSLSFITCWLLKHHEWFPGLSQNLSTCSVERVCYFTHWNLSEKCFQQVRSIDKNSKIQILASWIKKKTEKFFFKEINRAHFIVDFVEFLTLKKIKNNFFHRNSIFLSWDNFFL